MSIDIPAYFDPLSLDFRRHPYQVYARLRAENPIVFHPELNAWFFTRYDVEALLKNPELRNSAGIGQDLSQLPEIVQEFYKIRNTWLFSMDPPQHTRVRSLVHKAFTPKRIREMEDEIQQITDELLEDVMETGEMDFIEDFANPLPIRVIAWMMDIPVDDYTRFAKYTDDLVAGAQESFEAVNKNWPPYNPPQ